MAALGLAKGTALLLLHLISDFMSAATFGVNHHFYQGNVYT